MKIGLFLLIEPFQSVDTQLRRAQEMGFDCADVTDTNAGGSMLGTAGFSPTVSLDDNPFDVKRQFDAHGMTISTICAHANLLDPTKPSRYSTAEIMKAITMAAAIGVKDVVTTDSEPHSAWAAKLSMEQRAFVMAEKLYEPCRLAADYGVRVLLEPHGPVTDSVEGLKMVFKFLDDTPSLGINLDTGNSWIGLGDPVAIAREFKKKIHHIHWKDLGPEWKEKRGKVFGTGFSNIAIGDGLVDIKGVCSVLKDAGIESSTLEIIAPKETLQKSVAYLRSCGV